MTRPKLAEVPSRIASQLNGSRRLRLEHQADEGGIALYGRNAGRYPLDIVIHCLTQSLNKAIAR